MSANRSFQFFPLDHTGDIALKRCSLESQGLWMQMLCYMSQGNPYGYLLGTVEESKKRRTVLKSSTVEDSQTVRTNGPHQRSAPTVRDHGTVTVDRAALQRANLEPELARMTGQPAAIVRRCLKELEARGVFSRTDQGIIYSRRMVRDAERIKRHQDIALQQIRGSSGRFEKGSGKPPSVGKSSGRQDFKTVRTPGPYQRPQGPAGATDRFPSLPSHTKNPPPNPPPKGVGPDRDRLRQAIEQRRSES